MGLTSIFERVHPSGGSCLDGNGTGGTVHGPFDDRLADRPRSFTSIPGPSLGATSSSQLSFLVCLAAGGGAQLAAGGVGVPPSEDVDVGYPPVFGTVLPHSPSVFDTFSLRALLTVSESLVPHSPRVSFAVLPHPALVSFAILPHPPSLSFAVLPHPPLVSFVVPSHPPPLSAAVLPHPLPEPAALFSRSSDVSAPLSEPQPPLSAEVVSIGRAPQVRESPPQPPVVVVEGLPQLLLSLAAHAGVDGLFSPEVPPVSHPPPISVSRLDVFNFDPQPPSCCLSFQLSL